MVSGENEFVCQTFDGNFMAGSGCPAFVHVQPLRRSMAPFGEHPHAAPCRPSAAHMRTRGRCTITGPCMAPFPCRPKPDLRKGRRISSAQCSNGWRGAGGGDGHGPDRWTQLWESTRVLFVLSRASSALLCSHPPHTRNGRFLHRPQKMPPPIFRGPARCALSIVKWVPRRAPRVPARPPSADRSGIAERELGATPPAPRAALPDFRGPVCGALRAVNLYGSWELR